MNGAVRAVEVLTLLAGAGRPVPAAMIARECGIPRSSTYEIINALAAAGFAEPAEGGHKAGPRARELAGGVTIAGALAVLESFDQDAAQLTREELCRRSRLPLARVEPLVDDLLDCGLLAEDDGRMALGVRLAALAARSGPLQRLRAAARPVLAALRDTTGETANLVVRDAGEAVYLDQVESLHALRHAGWAGRRIALDRGAAASALRGADGPQVASDAVEVGVTAIACRVPLASEPAAAVSVTAPTARMTGPPADPGPHRREAGGERTRGGAEMTGLRCRGWQQEAALRMLENNLHPDVAEKPQELVVYGGIGKAARNQSCLDAIKRELTGLGDEETLLVQSGKPVAVFETHPAAPRVLIANSNLVGKWATWEHFRELDAAGLMMYGQMTAGSWIYIGTQGILQGTYETFAAIARLRFGGSLRGRLVVTAGLGGMGGAQPLAVTMNEGCALCIEVDLQRIERRIRERYLDERAGSLDDALERLEAAQREGRALSIGLLGNAAEILPELARRGAAVDVVTDQTSAHDPLNGYVPAGLTTEQADALRAADPDEYLERVGQSVLAHVDAIRTLGRAGAEAFDYGNALRGVAQDHGDEDAFAYPGFVPAYIRPLFCEGKGPFRWVALSGDPADIAATDRAILDLFGDQEHIRRWIELASERVAFQGLPARICWLGYGERHLAGLRFNEMVASGEVSAPIVIGRDHLDAGSVASPQRETESMRDGSDAVADWPILNALVNTATGASWVSFHHGGGVGMGLSLHAGQVSVADGTELAAERIRRTLLADPGMGIVRHVDAGYDEAIDAAERLGVRIPMR